MKPTLFLLVVALLVAAACDPTDTGNGGATTQQPTTTETTDEVVVASVDVEVGCALAEVFTGGPGATTLQAMGLCGEPIPDWQRLAAQGRITTDAAGEAHVTTVQGGAACGLLYVFHDTNLLVSDCQEGATASACVRAGTTGWNNGCSGTLTVVTPSGQITLTGTWVSITYDSTQELTILAVFDGEAEVAPSDAPEETAIVGGGEFWFTTPGDRIPGIAGVPSRTPITIEALPDVVSEMELASWFGGVLDRASADGVAGFGLDRLEVLNVRVAGGPFDDPALADAFLFGVDWPYRVDRLLEEPGAWTALFGTEPGIDLRNAPFDRDTAIEILESGKVSEVEVVVLHQRRDGALASAVLQANEGQEFGFGGLTGLFPLIFRQEFVPDEATARRFFQALTGDGVPVIWLARS